MPKVFINGVDIGVENQLNNQSYILSLMNKNHSFADEYGALYLSKYGNLVEGKNIIEIKYKRHENLNSGIISLQLVNSTCPFQDFLNIDLGNSKEGDFKTEFNITKSMIEKCDFKTISIKK